RFSGWSAADGAALLHERNGARLHAGRTRGFMTIIPPANPPRAQARPQTSTHHGMERRDDYAWLRDPDWREVMRDPRVLSADIRAYLEAENAYTGEALAPFGSLREKLFAEMKGRIKEDDSSVPSPDGPYAYYIRY